MKRFIDWSHRNRLTRQQWLYLGAWTVPIVVGWGGLGWVLTRIFAR